ncbi:hypothetical protein [Serratia marcescens]|uniref:hypothetical protein n=1 Tax=Serratia marcescens TaxID=615 RepID=UPI0019543757|nr:hypothetical protein [Serratia marcescens]EJC0202214.1 hypothetical protein [Serratia marcescens]
MDKLREEFEEKLSHDYGDDALLKNSDGDYVDWLTADLWDYWQASRASIVVESITPSDAPSGLIYQIGGAGLSHDEAICEGYSAGFNEAIRSIGLSIKGE